MSNNTRPDIAYTVGFARRNMESPSKTDTNDVKRIMPSFSNTKTDEVLYQKSNSNQIMTPAYSDSNFALHSQKKIIIVLKMDNESAISVIKTI